MSNDRRKNGSNCYESSRIQEFLKKTLSIPVPSEIDCCEVERIEEVWSIGLDSIIGHVCCHSREQSRARLISHIHRQPMMARDSEKEIGSDMS